MAGTAIPRPSSAFTTLDLDKLGKQTTSEDLATVIDDFHVVQEWKPTVQSTQYSGGGSGMVLFAVLDGMISSGLVTLER